MFLMKKNMRFSIEFIFVVRFWVYRYGRGLRCKKMKIQSYAKYVEDIKNAYNRISRPYRVEYNLKTKQFQVK